MGEHINEVDYHHIETVVLQAVVLLQQPLGPHRVVHLIIAEAVVTTKTLNLRLDKRCLIEVLSLLIVLVHPQVGKHSCYLVGHQPTEDGIARILRSCRQDGAVHILINIELVANFPGKHAPLVPAEVVYHD